MIDLGIMLTRRCNFKCGHCMYSCSPYTKGDMSREVILKCSHLVDDPEVYSVHVYGGEPFLNMNLFEDMFEWVYRPDKEFFVSTNGSFLLNREKRERVWKILRRIGNNFSLSPIRISNDRFHEEFWSEKLKEYLKVVGEQPHNAMFVFPEFWQTDDFYDVCTMIEDNKVYVEHRFTEINFNPSGRALKNGCYYHKRVCSCSLFDVDEQEHILDVRPNGDVDCCCCCDSAILGNVIEEPHLDIPLLKERLILLRSYMMKEYYKGDKLPLMKDICPICKTLRVKDDGVYMKNKKVFDKE